MMRILERYVAKTIILATGMVAVIITSVVFLMTLLGELKSIGTGDYGIFQAFLYVLLRTPNDLYQLSPMLLLLGAIAGLSILSSHHELAVMRTSGFSVRKIIYSVVCSALVMILALTVIGEAIGPNLSSQAEVHKDYQQNAGQAVTTATGIWLHIDNNFIHIKQVIGRQFLEGVTRYQFDNNRRLQTAYFAKRLLLQNNQWQMYDVVKTTFYPNRTHSEVVAEMPWDLKFNANLLNVGMLDPSELTLPKLAKYARYLEKNGLQASEYQYEFWQRVFQPLASLIMIFLAIPFVLGALHNATMGWRIMAGILVGFVFFILNALLGQLSIVFQIPPLIAALLPLLLFAIIGLLLAKGIIKR